MQCQLGLFSTIIRRVGDEDRDCISARLGGRKKALSSDLFDLAEREEQRLQVRILSEQNSRKIVNNDARRTKLSTRQ